MLQVCADRPSRDERGAIPPRPPSGNRPAGVAIATPADIRAGRHVDEFGRVVGHRKLEGRDVAVVAGVTIRVGGDHGLYIDQREIRIAQQQSARTRGLRRTGAHREQHYGQDSSSHGVALWIECVEAAICARVPRCRACRLRYIAAPAARSNTDRGCRRVNRTATGRSRRPYCCSQGRSDVDRHRNRSLEAFALDVRGRAKRGRNRRPHRKHRRYGSSR